MTDEIIISPRDRDVLRRLVEEQARAAALPVQREVAELWRRLNDLEPVRPMVWINEIPWHEMDVDGELTLQCADPWLREVETAAAPDALPVAAHARRHDRQRPHPLPRGDP